MLAQNMEKTMSCVSHPLKINAGRRWRNDTRVLLDREMICLFKLMFILYKLRGALPRWVILLGGFAELGYFTWWLVGWLDS